MKNIFILLFMLLFSFPSFSAEKDRGYCGRIINSLEVLGAEEKYGDHSFTKDPVYLLAIQCSSEPIDKKTTVDDLKEFSDIAFAIIWEPGIENTKLKTFAKNKSQVCVKARWGSPGPCSGGSSYDRMFTSTDAVYSINYLSQEKFSEHYFPYGKDIQ